MPRNYGEMILCWDMVSLSCACLFLGGSRIFTNLGGECTYISARNVHQTAWRMVCYIDYMDPALWEKCIKEPRCNDTMMVYGVLSCCVCVSLGRSKIYSYLERVCILPLGGMSSQVVWPIMCYTNYKDTALWAKCTEEPGCNDTMFG